MDPSITDCSALHYALEEFRRKTTENMVMHDETKIKEQTQYELA